MLIGFASAFLAALMYSLASVLYRRVLFRRDALLVTLVRVIPATITFFSILAFVGGLKEIFSYDLNLFFYAFITGSVGMVLGAYFYMVALKNVGVSIGYPISFSYPVHVAILAVLFLGEVLTVWVILALIFIILGITVIARGGDNFKTEGSILKGVTAAALASIIWGVSTVIVKIALSDSTPLGFAVLRLLWASLVSVPVIVAKRDELLSYTTKEVLLVSLGGVLGIGFGLVFAHISIELVGASISAIISASSPALSILLAYLLVGEELDKVNGLGVFLVLLGTVLVLFG